MSWIHKTYLFWSKKSIADTWFQRKKGGLFRHSEHQTAWDFGRMASASCSMDRVWENIWTLRIFLPLLTFSKANQQWSHLFICNIGYIVLSLRIDLHITIVYFEIYPSNPFQSIPIHSNPSIPINPSITQSSCLLHLRPQWPNTTRLGTTAAGTTRFVRFQHVRGFTIFGLLGYLGISKEKCCLGPKIYRICSNLGPERWDKPIVKACCENDVHQQNNPHSFLIVCVTSFMLNQNLGIYTTQTTRMFKKKQHTQKKTHKISTFKPHNHKNKTKKIKVLITKTFASIRSLHLHLLHLWLNYQASEKTKRFVTNDWNEVCQNEYM